MKSMEAYRSRIVRAVILSAVILLLGSGMQKIQQQGFKAVLSGKQEVPPVETKASGEAVFNLGPYGKKLFYQVTLNDIENVTMAHIHEAPSGSNGPVVVWLYPSMKSPVLIPGRFEGILASGAISSSDLTGPLAGKTLRDLLDAMVEGKTYVNVHTKQHPEGEVRGQVQTSGP